MTPARSAATAAGTGTVGYSGDGSAATAATLASPAAVAYDANGNLYIADANNHVVREVVKSTGVISTVAGTGAQGYGGDGGAATSALLDTPTGVAVDGSGNVYIADSHNQRVREVSGGNISTIAGSGAVSFAGGFGGDGASATAALLAKPTGVAVDAAGNVYVADSNNQRVRQIGGGAMTTVAGTGAQDYFGDGGAAASAAFDVPKGVGVDGSGNLAIADTHNEAVRSAADGKLSFANQAVGVASTAQTLTLSNTGTGSLTVSAENFSGSFSVASGGSCPAAPITLAASASCTLNIVFLPTAAAVASGSVNFSGTGVVPQSVLLAGTGIKATTITQVGTSLAAALVGQSVTFTAAVTAAGSVQPTGTVIFYDGSTQLGTAQTLVAGAASLTISTLAVGSHSITAVYSGDNNFTTSTSTVLPQSVVDFNFSISGSSSTSETVLPGQAATYSFTVQPVTGSFNYPVVLSATGLPPGATAVFTPSTITLGSSPVSFTMTIQTSAVARLLQHRSLVGGMSLALLLLPFAGRMRRGRRKMRPLLLTVLLLLSATAVGGLTGCGSGSGYFGSQDRSYNVQVIGTATGTGGATLQHSITVTLTVQ